MSKTLRRYQTTAPLGLGVLSLIGSEITLNYFKSTLKKPVISPYFQRSDFEEEAPGQEYSIILDLMKAIYGLDYVAINGGNQYVGVGFFDMTTSPATCIDVQNLQVDMAGATGPDTLGTAAIAAINTFATSQSYSLSDGIWPVFSVAGIIPPMVVSGVAKANSYAVVGSPTVAGGAGVVRFYIDSNGDGTGTAPSAVFTGSLQAVVPSSTATYQLQSFTVDTNKKYIDVKMGTLSTGLAGIIPILTGAIGNTANGVAVNCFVLVQK